MRIQVATLALAAAALAASGCGGDSCGEETPPIGDEGVPNCTAAPGALVQVPIRVCPECDQATPRCDVHLDDLAQGAIQLEPLTEVCDPNPSCPVVDPSTCAVSPVTCSFTAPAAGTYDLVVITPEGMELTGTLDVSGGPSSCSFL